MWIVLDNNEANPVSIERAARALGPEGFSLSAPLLAELVLRPDAKAILGTLSHYSLRIGAEFSELMKRLASLDESGIRQLSPFDGVPPELHLAKILGLGQDHEAARRIKEGNRSYINQVFAESTAARRILAGFEERDRIGSIQEAERLLGGGANSFLGSLVVKSVSNWDTQSVSVQDPEKLFAAIVGNMYFGRFFRAVLAYFLAVSGLWKQRRGMSLDYGPGGGKTNDDWTDLSLLCCAGDHDAILTADKRLADLVRISDRDGQFRVGSVDEICGADYSHEQGG